MRSSWEVGPESATSPLLPAPLAAAGHGAAPHVTILMATRNGAPFLETQLESIAAQSHANWSLRIGDDGSDDGTRKIIAAFRARHPTRDIRLLEGPRRGAAANFLALLGHGPPPRAYVAFSDQDDSGWRTSCAGRSGRWRRIRHSARCSTAAAPSSPMTTAATGACPGITGAGSASATRSCRT